MSHVNRRIPHPLFAECSLSMPGLGNARCHCGALLLKVCGPTNVEVKCRRCGRLVEVRFQAVEI
jgi:hypothetical protein